MPTECHSLARRHVARSASAACQAAANTRAVACVSVSSTKSHSGLPLNGPVDAECSRLPSLWLQGPSACHFASQDEHTAHGLCSNWENVSCGSKEKRRSSAPAGFPPLPRPHCSIADAPREGPFGEGAPGHLASGARQSPTAESLFCKTCSGTCLVLGRSQIRSHKNAWEFGGRREQAEWDRRQKDERANTEGGQMENKKHVKVGTW